MPSSQPKMCLHLCEWMRVYIFFLGPMNGMCAFNGMKTWKPVQRARHLMCVSLSAVRVWALQPISIKEKREEEKNRGEAIDCLNVMRVHTQNIMWGDSNMILSWRLRVCAPDCVYKLHTTWIYLPKNILL